MDWSSFLTLVIIGFLFFLMMRHGGGCCGGTESRPRGKHKEAPPEDASPQKSDLPQ